MPAAGCLHVAYGDHDLDLSWANRDHDADAVAGWVVDLDKPALTAVVGMLFPPAIIGTALVGGAIGAASGHPWRGISRSDVKELGELIDANQAALLVIGASNLEQAVDKATLKAEKHVAKQLDVSTADVDAAVKDAAGQVG